MCQDHNDKRETIQDGGIELPNQEKNQNARRKGNLYIHHQINGDERKKN